MFDNLDRKEKGKRFLLLGLFFMFVFPVFVFVLHLLAHSFIFLNLILGSLTNFGVLGFFSAPLLIVLGLFYMFWDPVPAKKKEISLLDVFNRLSIPKKLLLVIVVSVLIFSWFSLVSYELRLPNKRVKYVSVAEIAQDKSVCAASRIELLDYVERFNFPYDAEGLNVRFNGRKIECHLGSARNGMQNGTFESMCPVGLARSDDCFGIYVNGERCVIDVSPVNCG